MRRQPGRVSSREPNGRSVSVWLKPAEEDIIDAAVLPDESRAEMIRDAALAAARARLLARGKAKG
jgi:hypothetical protein